MLSFCLCRCGLPLHATQLVKPRSLHGRAVARNGHIPYWQEAGSLVLKLAPSAAADFLHAETKGSHCTVLEDHPERLSLPLAVLQETRLLILVRLAGQDLCLQLRSVPPPVVRVGGKCVRPSFNETGFALDGLQLDVHFLELTHYLCQQPV